MGYPYEIDSFIAKLNKRSTSYVIQDEVIQLVDNIGEKIIDHDNVKTDTLEIWTGIEKTGFNVLNYTIKNPDEESWKTVLRVSVPGDLSVDKVYVTYETYGDKVEAEDINAVQRSIVETQTELERHKAELTHSTFVHTQILPTNAWTITHNLNKYPSVTVVDSGNSVVIGDISYDSTNVITIKFQGAFAGLAYLN